MSINETTQARESDTTRQGARRWLSRMVAVVYGLVMFEVVIMVSPFAFYFYAAYGPTLKWLNHSGNTEWLTGFLLPHAVFTTSPFLEFVRWDFGRYFLSAIFANRSQVSGYFSSVRVTSLQILLAFDAVLRPRDRLETLRTDFVATT